MQRIVWCSFREPAGIEVSQVYGFLLDAEGRLLLQNDRGRYNLPGGKPEDGESHLETLAREALEESQVSFTNPRYLGYLEVNDVGYAGSRVAQVRYVARIERLHPIRPDPCTGRAYARELVDLELANALLGWGAHGAAQIDAVRSMLY